MAWMKTKVSISPSFKPKDRVAISDAIIEYIKNRTMDGVDKNLEKFANYKPSYAAFKGVGVGDVDLVFGGDMLSDLKLLSHKNGELTIGFEKGSKSNDKAEGNIKGTYGQPRPVQKPRDFLGISPAEVKALMEEIPLGKDDLADLSDDEIDRLARQAAEEIFGDIF